MPGDVRIVEELCRRFSRAPSRALLRRLLWEELPQFEELTGRPWTRVQEAIFAAAGSSEWRLAEEGLSGLSIVEDQDARKADLIVKALLSRSLSVRVAATFPISRAGVSRAVLRRLEAVPVKDLLNFEAVVAIDVILSHLRGRSDRCRVARLVRRLRATKTRSHQVRWKIEDTLHAPEHLGLPRDRCCSD